MQRLYIGVIMATRHEAGGQIRQEIELFEILAQSLEEARGSAIGHVEGKWPQREGWSYYVGTFTAIERATVAEWLEAYDRA